MSKINSIKGFDQNLSCRGFQFEIGKTYEVKGKVEACSNGFHSCPSDEETSPLAVFEYYPPAVSRYCEVQADGKIDRQGNKIASAKITVGVEITLHEMIGRFIKWATDKAGGALAASNSGYQGAASNSGTRGAASNSGIYGAASNSGTRGAASNSGDCGAASNSGDCGAASNSGTRGAASNSGDYGAAMSHSYDGKVMCEGDGQALYCSEFNDNLELVSNACGITGQDGLKAGVWYTCKGGKLVEVV